MNTPRALQESPAGSASSRAEASAVLEPVGARSDDSGTEAELHRAIESAASRLLGFAQARGAEERDPDEE